MNGQLQPGTVLVSQAQIPYKVLALLGAGDRRRAVCSTRKARNRS